MTGLLARLRELGSLRMWVLDTLMALGIIALVVYAFAAMGLLT